MKLTLPIKDVRALTRLMSEAVDVYRFARTSGPKRVKTKLEKMTDNDRKMLMWKMESVAKFVLSLQDVALIVEAEIDGK